MKPRLGALLTHPVQYYSPWFKHLAAATDLTVYYAHRQTPEDQARAGFGKPFEWDVPLLDGYEWRWLKNVASRPGLTHFAGCDTPEIGDIVRSRRFDAFLMCGWNRRCFLQAGWAALRSGTPVLIRLDSQLLTPRLVIKRAIKWPVYSALLPRVAHYLSPGVRADDYLRHYRVPAPRIHRLPHMVDTERFSEVAEHARASGRAHALRADNGTSDDTFVLLFVGKLLPKKCPLLLLQALKQMLEAKPMLAAKMRLWIVGDGPLRGELESFVRIHSLPVRFLGFVNQNEMPAVYASADCLVLPSNGEETWGLVVNEAFACGLPAIVSGEAGCAPELITEGRTGWTMRTPDADELAGLFRKAAEEAPGLPRENIEAVTESAGYRAGTRLLLEVVQGLRGVPR